MISKIIGMITEIEGMINVDFENLQPWTLLEKWNLNESKNINGTISTKIYEDDHCIKFISVFPPGTKFSPHWHDCAETCTILAGEMSCLCSKRKWSTGETAVFSKGERHTPYNSSRSSMLYILVEFYK